MASLKRYFRKKHKYETQSDLQYMNAEQIVNLNPNDVSNYIETETGGIPLEGVKRRALYRLLAIKKQNKATPNEYAKQRAITQFLQNEGIKSNPVTDKLMVNAHTEMIKEQLEMKDLENRLKRLDNKTEIPYTEEEVFFKRLQNIGGKRKRKTVSKRIRREKSKKSKKGFKGRRTRRRV